MNNKYNWRRECRDMSDGSWNRMAVVAAIGIIIASAVGIGYATDFIGQTSSAPQTINTKYVVMEINGDGSGTLTNVFQFTTAAARPDLYTDIVIDSDSPTSYRTLKTGENHGYASDAVRIKIIGSNTTEAILSAVLTTPLNDVTATLQFYSDNSCLNSLCSETELSTNDTAIGTFSCNTNMWCIARLYLDAQTYSSLPGSISLDIRFTATASVGEADP